MALLDRRRVSATQTFANKLLLGHSCTGNDPTGEPKLYTASDRSSDADADVSESVPKRRTTMVKRRVLQRPIEGHVDAVRSGFRLS